MPITINGDGTITGLAVGGLPDGTVDAGTLASGAAVPADGSITAAKLASNAVTTAKLAADSVTTAKLAADSVTNPKIATNANYACAHYIYRESGSGTTMSSGGNGSQCPITDVKLQKNITLDTGNSRWTHATTGIYFIIVRYRQESGGDIWSVFGVTKGGNNNCVGVSARTGSENSHNEAYNVIYTVDSTSATYQLQGWSGAANKVVKRPDGQGKPSWSNYDTLVGYSEGNNGVMLDYNIFKIGDL